MVAVNIGTGNMFVPTNAQLLCVVPSSVVDLPGAILIWRIAASMLELFCHIRQFVLSVQPS